MPIMVVETISRFGDVVVSFPTQVKELSFEQKIALELY